MPFCALFAPHHHEITRKTKNNITCKIYFVCHGNICRSPMADW
ncbi:MAG: hypothetical protein K5890_11130 [Bacteroidales bacterium]|nr:hypothetical protein [Bacteroidales bacterium]